MIEDGTHHDAAVRDGEERLLATVEYVPLVRRCFRSHRQGWGQAGRQRLWAELSRWDSHPRKATLARRVPNSRAPKAQSWPLHGAHRDRRSVVSPVDTGGVLTDGRDRTTEIGDCHFCAFSTEQHRSRCDPPAPHPL